MKIQEKRLSKIFKARPAPTTGKLSPTSMRGYPATVAAVGGKRTAGLDGMRKSTSKKKYEDVRSKLEGYHDPVQLLKKMEHLEK